MGFFAVPVLFAMLLSMSGVSTAEVEDESSIERCDNFLHGCSCFDYDYLVGLSCENLSNFDSFKKLADGSVFPLNTIYEITLSGMSILPAGTFQNLILYRLFLVDDALADIEDEAFVNVLLGRFHVRRSSLQRIPSLQPLRNSLTTLNLHNSRLTAIEEENLQDLPLLQIVSFVNNSISWIDPNAFLGTTNISVLDLSYNRLTHLPPTLLNDWNNLQKLALSHNQLVQVQVLLFTISQPKFIFLDSNNLTSVDSILRPNMLNVEVLELSNNPIQTISVTSFNGKVPNIHSLFLDHCKIADFDVSHYKDLQNISTLDLSFNSIEKIPKQSIEFGHHLGLDFIGNRIVEFEAEVSPSVISINLSQNKLQSLGKTLQFMSTSHAIISFNELHHLTADNFRGSSGLSNLNLQGNQIQRIDTLTFLPIKEDLVYLDLSSNLIRNLNGSVRFLDHLQSLNLSTNNILNFEEGEFTSLSQLSTLYVDRNQLMTLGAQLQKLPQLQYLDVRHNSLKSLSRSELPRNLRYLYLTGNPIECSCKMIPFLKWIQLSESPDTDVPLCPAQKMIGKNSVTCPGPCSCTCSDDGDRHFISVDCSSRYMSVLPPFLSGASEYWSQNGLTVSLHGRNDEPQFHIEDKVLSLNLENNSFHSLDGIRLPAKLQELHLVNNQLQRLPEYLLYTLPKLRNLTLSGNPWECGCSSLALKTWLSSRKSVVPDVNKVYCFPKGGASTEKGRLLLHISDHDLCPRKLVTYLVIGSALLACTLLFSILSIIYVYRKRGKRLYRGYAVAWNKNEDFDGAEECDATYDAMICYSDNEQDLALNAFLPTFEMEMPGIKLYFPHRTSLLPRDAHSLCRMIVSVIKKTDNIIAFFSGSFVECDWCKFQIQAAYRQWKKDKIKRLVVIEIGDVPKSLSRDIRECLQGSFRLKWGEETFWEKLIDHLKGEQNVQPTGPFSWAMRRMVHTEEEPLIPSDDSPV